MSATNFETMMCQLRTPGRELEHYESDDPSHRHAAPEPQEPKQRDRQYQPVAFVTPPRAKAADCADS